MTQQIAVPEEAPPPNPRYADAFVIFSVTVLSCATGAWVLQQLGLALWAGMGTALAVYAVLLSIHLIMRRSLTAATETDPPALARLKPTSMPTPAQPAAKQAKAPAAPPSAPPPPAAEITRRPEPPAPQGVKPGGELPPTRPANPFNFRPSREPGFSPSQQPTLPTPPPGTAPQATMPAGPLEFSQPEISVDFVEESIKRLADALNSTTPSGRAPPSPEPADDTEAMIGRSVAALQSAARAMQAPASSAARKRSGWWPSAKTDPETEPVAPMPALDLPPRAGPPAQFPPAAAGPPQLNPQLARIAEAVAAERIEVLLEPIHALVEGRPRHFEVSTRLRTADGATLEQAELARTVQGSGLMARIDAQRIIRAARVAGRLGRRGRQGAVLAATSSESLTDTSFLDAAAAGPGGKAGMSLVLAFAQSEVRAFRPVHTEALATLAGLGFRFALEAVTDLDMDFASLKQMGFAFVELDAPVFLDGLPCAGERIPASDICRHLADFGLSLIVGRIDDDWLLARILGFGVLFGKGSLFGGARLVKDEVVAGPSAA
jgi:cyclic-di-GMP phosphodiesterase TipF (flagellum assembly factor)